MARSVDEEVGYEGALARADLDVLPWGFGLGQLLHVNVVVEVDRIEQQPGAGALLVSLEDPRPVLQELVLFEEGVAPLQPGVPGPGAHTHGLGQERTNAVGLELVRVVPVDYLLGRIQQLFSAAFGDGEARNESAALGLGGLVLSVDHQDPEVVGELGADGEPGRARTHDDHVEPIVPGHRDLPRYLRQALPLTVGAGSFTCQSCCLLFHTFLS